MGTRAAERFWAKVGIRSADECWPWLAATFKATGYGQVRWDGKPTTAHRVALSLKLGRPLEAGMDSCHTCDNRPCCNPSHLFEGTRTENMRDASVKGRTHRGGLPFSRRGRGERCGSSKLSTGQVVEIRSLAGSESFRSLGRRFGVSHRIIGGIVNRTLWVHV